MFMDFKRTLQQIALIVGVFVVGSALIAYLDLPLKEKRIFNTWSELETKYSYRVILSNSILTAVKAHNVDPTALAAVEAARLRAMSIVLNNKTISDPQQVQEYLVAQQHLQAALEQVLDAAQNNQTLQANLYFAYLQQQLEFTKNNIQQICDQLNADITSFNAGIKQFPGLVVNKLLLHLEAKQNIT